MKANSKKNKLRNDHVKILPLTLIKGKIINFFNSDDFIENIFALFIVTGLRKVELLQKTNIKPIDHNAISLDFLVKKRDQ